MRNILFIFFVIFFIQSRAYCETMDDAPIYEKNYLQIDPFFLDYQTVDSSDELYYQNNTQLITARPSFLFYINIEDLIFRPFVSLDPTLSNSQGSFSAGKLFSKTIEFGLYSLLNHTENMIGKTNNQNGTVISQFLIGPYLVFYPYERKGQLLQIYSRLSYEYGEYKKTISGVTANTSIQKGINFNLALLYSIKLSHQIYFAPNANFTYFTSVDYAGNNTTKVGTQWQIIPVSFQITL